jgi:hypothetical protein
LTGLSSILIFIKRGSPLFDPPNGLIHS